MKGFYLFFNTPLNLKFIFPRFKFLTPKEVKKKRKDFRKITFNPPS